MRTWRGRLLRESTWRPKLIGTLRGREGGGGGGALNAHNKDHLRK